MSIKGLFGRLLPRRATDAPRIESTRFKPIHSARSGFTCFVGDEAMLVLDAHAHVEWASIEALIDTVFKKCIALGFAHGDPVCFLIDAQNLKNERTTMTVGKIEPPLPMGGETVTRSVFIYGQEFIDDMANVERQTYEAFRLAGVVLDTEKKQQLAETIAKAKNVKALMGLSHELVHIFGTDEYRSLMPLLGLDLLEILTDSINFDLHYEVHRHTAPH